MGYGYETKTLSDPTFDQLAKEISDWAKVGWTAAFTPQWLNGPQQWEVLLQRPLLDWMVELWRADDTERVAAYTVTTTQQPLFDSAVLVSALGAMIASVTDGKPELAERLEEVAKVGHEVIGGRLRAEHHFAVIRAGYRLKVWVN